MAPLPPPTQAGLPLSPPGAPSTSVWWQRRLPEDAGALPGAGALRAPLARPRLVPARSFGCLMETGFKGKAARTFPKKIINGLCGAFSPPHTIPKVLVGGKEESGRAWGRRGDVGCPWPALTAAQPGTMVLSSRRPGSGTRWLPAPGVGGPPRSAPRPRQARAGGAMAQPHTWGSVLGGAQPGGQCEIPQKYSSAACIPPTPRIPTAPSITAHRITSNPGPSDPSGGYPPRAFGRG